MSFPTFSGSSRRPRNVNMSGQKNLNPFAATSWTPSASSNASKTVADAQAERRQRQHERAKLKAAEAIQRTWRGHRVRRRLRDERRVALDDLYRDSEALDPATRSCQALHTVVTTLDPSRQDDRLRLERFSADLRQSDCSALATATLPQLRRLTSQLLVLLRLLSNDNVPQSILATLLSICESNFRAFEDNLVTFYTITGTYCRNGNSNDETSLELLKRAVLAPIYKDHGLEASKAFALSFLSQPDLKLFEAHVASFAEHVDMEKVSAAIVEAYAIGFGSSAPADARLWLLAHFIALGNCKQDMSLGSSYLNAMYIQLSSLLTELKKHHIGQRPMVPVNAAADSRKQFPSFIDRAVSSLVERDEISHILEKFTTNFAGSSEEEFKEASLLAAYILTLIGCFPSLSDDIRMKLYLANIPSKSGYSTSIKFFWDAMVRTKIFALIQSDEQGSTLALLQQQDSEQTRDIKDNTLWDREWRAILLFLELYIFVLRLTDDEDFAFPWASAAFEAGPISRLRQCMLTLPELRGLSLFLRNLAFTLYYNESDLEEYASRFSQPSAPKKGAGGLLYSSASSSSQSKKKKQDTYNVISGVDFDTFRSTVTTAMRMVYERDSRRQFLPNNHWLMTYRFDMHSFMDNVVLEVERQRQLNEEGADGDVDMDEEDEGEDEDDTHDGLGRFAKGYASHALRIERLRAAHKKEQRKRLLAAVGPKLEILRNMPFIIPFDVRVKIFRKLVIVDKLRRRNGTLEADQWRMQILDQLHDPSRARDRLERHHAKVRRGKVFDDAFAQFYQLRDGLKEPIQITFVDQFDIPEAGIDGGGVTKEFLTSITKEAFTEDLSLFVANSNNALYPNPCALDQRQEKLRQYGLRPDSEQWREDIADFLAQYEFLGRIIGKCLYEGILLDVVFAGFFLLKWAAAASDSGYRANINDLREFDEELYHGMMRLKNYSDDVSELGLDFTIEDQVSQPNEPTRIVTRQLMPDGDKTAVTNENKLLYVNYVARHRLVAQPFLVTRAFLTGLGTIIEPTWLSMFNQSELQRLVGGDSTEIDIEDLRRNTICSGLYEVGDDGQDHPTVQMFWDVMRSLEDSQRRDVLKYVTSTPRAPLLGFSQLSPRFSIRDGGRDTTRLPSASTCVNLLKLPTYDSAQLLRDKLLYAVSSGAGFDLS
ncbi:hypothetical protein BD289DRAFT_478537 [Coniella lustricola]|uniref:HECT-type E3 ubiquitin transferase n=1 Tax=Coniella lustricola TaxID=2025994 RepID=A0A2T3ALT6_9PEZI|nr:hypothetical protein BD289DRAFT_478537 [Coniella lustricola]